MWRRHFTDRAASATWNGRVLEKKGI
jgi:hypothetical protein